MSRISCRCRVLLQQQKQQQVATAPSSSLLAAAPESSSFSSANISVVRRRLFHSATLLPLSNTTTTGTTTPTSTTTVQMDYPTTTTTGAETSARTRSIIPSTRTTARTTTLPPTTPGIVDEPYVSPFKEYFDRMERNGPTTLGTTDEFLQLERQIEQQYGKILKCGLPEKVLRFTAQSFGRTLVKPHVHNNEHKVTLHMNVDHLPFEKYGLEWDILKEIVGRRLSKTELRLQTNRFGSRIENKRHLVDMFDRIICSCQRLANELRRQEQQKEEETGGGEKEQQDDDEEQESSSSSSA